MNIKKITTDVYYVGVNDRVTTLFEAQWPLPYGVSYNSYIITGTEKTALIDTVKIDEVRGFLNNLGGIPGEKKIDYLVVNHMEPDHSGSIPEVVRAYPDIKIVCNMQTVGMIKGFCGITDDSRFLVIKDGETLSLGGHTLSFHLTPMVHWPETMVTYVDDLNLLFSGDAFGTFGALNGAVIDADMELDVYFEEMYRYYSNIVGKYGKFVTNALKKLSGLKLDYICSTHGPVWKENIAQVVEIYRSLAAYESEPGIVIVYGSMYGNTADAAEAIASELAQAGERKIIVHNAAISPMSNMIRDAFRYDTLIVGSSTYSMRLLPAVESFLTAMETREIKNKTFAAFGNFVWAPGVIGNKFNEFSQKMNLPLAATLSFKQALNDASAANVKEFAQQVLQARNK